MKLQVYRPADARQLSDGRWCVVARAFVAQVGRKQIIRTRTCYAESPEAAAAAANQFVANERAQYLTTGIVPEHCRDTLAAYGRKWLDDRKGSGEVRRGTLHGYSELFRTYIEEPSDPALPRLGRIRMDRLQPQQIKALYRYLCTAPNARGRTSNGRARELHAVLRQVFKDALNNKVITDPLDLMLRGVFGRRKRKRPQAYSGDQLAALLKAADTDRYRAFWYLFAFTGKRPGELLALTRDDVDLERCVITVSKRLRVIRKRVRGEDEGRWELDDPKTENSASEVEFPPELVPILRQHLDAEPATRKARKRWGAKYGDLVFTTKGGFPVDWTNLRANYRRICMRAGLGTFVGEMPVKPSGRPGPQKRRVFKPLLHPYALRHTHATLLLEDGVPIEEISGRLGHAKTSFTLDTYIGKRQGQKRAVAASSKRLLALTVGT